MRRQRFGTPPIAADPTNVESATNLRYTGPITINTTQMIRARVFTPNLLPGESDAQCYLLLDATLRGFFLYAAGGHDHDLWDEPFVCGR
jgi:hypothetical protein